MRGEPIRPVRKLRLSLPLLNDFHYCWRRAALKLFEGWREANEHRARGAIAREHADLTGYKVVKDVVLLRALWCPVGLVAAVKLE